MHPFPTTPRVLGLVFVIAEFGAFAVAAGVSPTTRSGDFLPNLDQLMVAGVFVMLGGALLVATWICTLVSLARRDLRWTQLATGVASIVLIPIALLIGAGIAVASNS